MAANKKSNQIPKYKKVQNRAIHRQLNGIGAKTAATLGSFFGSQSIRESAQLIGNSLAQNKHVFATLYYTDGGMEHVDANRSQFDSNYININTRIQDVAVFEHNVGQVCTLPVLCLLISYTENNELDTCPYACAYKIPKRLHKMFRSCYNIKVFSDAYIKAVNDGLGITDLQFHCKRKLQ